MCYLKKAVLKNITKFTEHLRSPFNKVADLRLFYKTPPDHCFCEYAQRHQHPVYLSSISIFNFEYLFASYGSKIIDKIRRFPRTFWSYYHKTNLVQHFPNENFEHRKLIKSKS